MQYLWVFVISMLPLIELRGALPYSQVVGLPLGWSLLICVLGNMLPIPFLYLFARRILVWGQEKPYIGRIFSKILIKGERAGQRMEAKAGRGIYWGLFLFVGIPLPGTGAWTGILASSLLDLHFGRSLLACLAGILLAAAIMGISSAGLVAVFASLFS